MFLFIDLQIYAMEYVEHDLDVDRGQKGEKGERINEFLKIRKLKILIITISNI